MTSSDDLELRRRSIFDRLRAEVEGEAEGAEGEQAADAAPGGGPSSSDGEDDAAEAPAGFEGEGNATADPGIDPVPGVEDERPDWEAAPEPGKAAEPDAETAVSELAGGGDDAGPEVEAPPGETEPDAHAETSSSEAPVPAPAADDVSPQEDRLPNATGAAAATRWVSESETGATADDSDLEPAAAEGAAGAAPPAGDAATAAPSPPEARGGDVDSAVVVPDVPAEAAPAGAPADAAPLAPEVATPPVAPAARARPALPRIFAVANQKGGVGKTTTAVNLSAGLAELGYRVLVIDLDPQGNATTGLGINARNLDVSIYDVLLHDTPMEDTIEPSSLRNLFVVPATIDLAGAEIELVPAFSRELRLRKALDTVLDDFDYVFIDCPPSLGLLTVNGLAAATEVLVPIQCEYYALEGLGQLLRNVNLVQANLNPTLELSTIVLTMFDARTKLAEQVVGDVRSHFGAKVCRNVVPRTVRLSEAPSFGQPITLFDPTSRGAIAYRELAKEVSGGPAERLG